MKILIVVQARLGSSRLPGKVLLPLAGAPLLIRMLERVRMCQTPFELIVATTENRADDPLAELVRAHGYPVFRGHETDLLDRHFRAAAAYRAEVVVKIPSDCPLIDPAVIDRVLARFLSERADFVSNLHPATYPDGNDVEVMTFDALAAAHREARAPHEREHTTPFIWDQPERFRIANVTWETGLNYSMSHRLTIDYPEDYQLIAGVFERLWRPARTCFSLDEIVALLESSPELYAINRRYAGVNWYRHHLADLRTIDTDATRRLEGTE